MFIYDTKLTPSNLIDKGTQQYSTITFILSGRKLSGLLYPIDLWSLYENMYGCIDLELKSKQYVLYIYKNKD